MKTALVVIVLERLKLSLQVDSIPEQRVVKKLTTNSPDQAFHEGCETGVNGMLLMRSISRIRRFACHR